MSSFATLGGNACTRGRVQIPTCWRGWLDVELVEPVELAGAQTFALGKFTAQTTVISGGVAEGRARYRLVFGRGGWGKVIPEKSYINDAGIKVSNVLQDAAAECGEALGALPTTRLGAHYARANGAASNVLHELAPRAWRVDLDGVTQINAWPAAEYTGDGARVRTDLATGVIELAVDEVANLQPGVTVDGHGPAVDVEYEFDAKRLTVRVYFGSQVSERLEAMRRIVESLFPRMKYAGTFDFRVVDQTGERFDLQPVRASSGLDDLRNVPTRGHPGIKAQVTLGEIVAVTFADNDPSRPQIIAHDNPDSPAWRPTLIKCGDGGDFVALKGSVDTLQSEFDKFATVEYPAHAHGHAVGPTASVTPPPTRQAVGALPASELVKVD